MLFDGERAGEGKEEMKERVGLMGEWRKRRKEEQRKESTPPSSPTQLPPAMQHYLLKLVPRSPPHHLPGFKLTTCSCELHTYHTHISHKQPKSQISPTFSTHPNIEFPREKRNFFRLRGEHRVTSPDSLGFSGMEACRVADPTSSAEERLGTSWRCHWVPLEGGRGRCKPRWRLPSVPS